MKTEIFIVSHAKDAAWLGHCLHSIQKFATGFSGTTVLYPVGDESALGKICERFGATQKTFKQASAQLGHLHQNLMKCRADEWCPNADFILHTDSDCIFREPVKPEDYFVDGKPVLCIESYEHMYRTHPNHPWQAVVEKTLKRATPYETMRRHPMVNPRGIYAATRREVEKAQKVPFDSYVLSQKNTFPYGFCEFNTIGAIALESWMDKYHFIDVGEQPYPRSKIIQFWSHRAPTKPVDIWLDGKNIIVTPQTMIDEILGKDPEQRIITPTLDQSIKIGHRSSLGDYLNIKGLVGRAVEIGAMHGGFAREVLGKWKGLEYYLVDLWAKQPQDVYRERTDTVDYEQKFKDCQRLATEDTRVRLVRKASVEAAKEFPDGFFDSVYIDANHSYRAVLEDMDAWWPKVKIGGLFGGHDYGLDTNWPNWCEVKPAVDRWMGEKGFHFTVDGDNWWKFKE